MSDILEQDPSANDDPVVSEALKYIQAKLLVTNGRKIVKVNKLTFGEITCNIFANITKHGDNITQYVMDILDNLKRCHLVMALKTWFLTNPDFDSIKHAILGDKTLTKHEIEKFDWSAVTIERVQQFLMTPSKRFGVLCKNLTMSYAVLLFVRKLIHDHPEVYSRQAYI